MQYDRGESILSKLSSPSSSAIRRGPKNIDLHPVTNTTYTEVFTSPVKVSRKSTVEQNSWPIFHGPHSGLISDNLKTIPFAKTQNQPVNQLLMTATFWNNLSLCIRQQQEQQHHQHEQHPPYQLQPTEKIHQKLPHLNYTVRSFDDAESINPSPEDKGFGLKLGRLGDKRTRYIDESLAITGTTLAIKSTAATTPSSTQPMTVQATSTDLQENLVNEALSENSQTTIRCPVCRTVIHGHELTAHLRLELEQVRDDQWFSKFSSSTSPQSQHETKRHASTEQIHSEMRYHEFLKIKSRRTMRNNQFKTSLRNPGAQHDQNEATVSLENVFCPSVSNLHGIPNSSRDAWDVNTQ